MSGERQIILNFHGIGEPHEGVEAAERPYWISEAFFEGIVDHALASAKADQVIWTFDDGNRSDLTVGARLLHDRGRQGIFFVLAGRFADPRYLSRTDTRTLADMGMTIGLHGRNHIAWRGLDAAGLAEETVGARRCIEDVVGIAVDDVGIPFGAYDRSVIRHLVKCGFNQIYTSDGGPSRSTQRIRSRTSLRSDMSMDRVTALIDDNIPVHHKLRRAVSTTLRRYIV